MNDSYLHGLPVRPGIVLPWKISFRELALLGDPTQEEWKRWKQDRDARYFEEKKKRLLWNKIQLSGVPSLVAVEVSHNNPETLFTQATLYYSRRDSLEKELTQQFGEPFIHRYEYEDRDGVQENIEKHWIIGWPDSKTRVTFVLDGTFKVLYTEEK